MVFRSILLDGNIKGPWVIVCAAGPVPLFSLTGPAKVPDTRVAVMLEITIVNAGLCDWLTGSGACKEIGT